MISLYLFECGGESLWRICNISLVICIIRVYLVDTLCYVIIISYPWLE